MPEVKFEAKTYIVHMKCGDCGQGWMYVDYSKTKFTELDTTQGYMHVCDNCGWPQTYDSTYPRVVNECGARVTQSARQD